MRSIKCYFPISILCQYLPYIYGSLQYVWAWGSSCIAIILVVCLLFNFIHICRDISYFLIIHNNIANKLITSKIKGRCTALSKPFQDSKQNPLPHKIRIPHLISGPMYETQLKSAPFTFMGSRP